MHSGRLLLAEKIDGVHVGNVGSILVLEVCRLLPPWHLGHQGCDACVLTCCSRHKRRYVLLVDGELANGREGDVSHQPLNWEDVVICHVASTNGSHREVSEETRDFIVVWIHGGKRLIPLAQLVILWVPASYGFVENDGLKACPLPLLSPDACWLPPQSEPALTLYKRKSLSTQRGEVEDDTLGTTSEALLVLLVFVVEMVIVVIALTETAVVKEVGVF